MAIIKTRKQSRQTKAGANKNVKKTIKRGGMREKKTLRKMSMKSGTMKKRMTKGNNRSKVMRGGVKPTKAQKAAEKAAEKAAKQKKKAEKAAAALVSPKRSLFSWIMGQPKVVPAQNIVVPQEYTPETSEVEKQNPLIQTNIHPYLKASRTLVKPGYTTPSIPSRESKELSPELQAELVAKGVVPESFKSRSIIRQPFNPSLMPGYVPRPPPRSGALSISQVKKADAELKANEEARQQELINKITKMETETRLGTEQRRVTDPTYAFPVSAPYSVLSGVEERRLGSSGVSPYTALESRVPRAAYSVSRPGTSPGSAVYNVLERQRHDPIVYSVPEIGGEYFKDNVPMRTRLPSESSISSSDSSGSIYNEYFQRPHYTSYQLEPTYINQPLDSA